jgi:hypothetical protein
MTIAIHRAKALGTRSGFLTGFIGLFIALIMFRSELVWHQNTLRIYGLVDMIREIFMDWEYFSLVMCGFLLPLVISVLLFGKGVGRSVLSEGNAAWPACFMAAVADYVIIVMCLFITVAVQQGLSIKALSDFGEWIGFAAMGLIPASIPMLVLASLRALWLVKQRKRAEHVLW